MTTSNQTYTLVMDIGKTHVKVHVLDTGYNSIFSKHMSNTVLNKPPYPCADVDGIWQFFQIAIKEAAAKYAISGISITTHGATAALIDRAETNGNGLVLPVLDYEYTEINVLDASYSSVRPDFASTYSPSLPAGLNLGRQLHWLSQSFNHEFTQATDILMYPQYWVWRLTGYLASEITSLGCHTDLWDLNENGLSSLVDHLACRDKFPALKPAWQCCGAIKPELSQALGLSPDCQVYSGLHDSNASFLRYRLTQGDKPFTVISSGTWTILMASQVSVKNLEPTKDMLANIDALGTPIACARFMGGREFAAICDLTGAKVDDAFTEADLQTLIDSNVFALPDFSGGSGPFSQSQGQVVGELTTITGAALATLYCAYMVDYQLSLLEAKGDIYIEGAFLKNPLLCGLIKQLRNGQAVHLSRDDTGTVAGTACLTQWGANALNVESSSANETRLQGLDQYKATWLALIADA
ncbi:FGGY-family carbohydrate kinase [Algibacillus agarilyticus]|uniref:FGGY-family carbohydrate kinase n=1 Tax=Algibacillus agarilyticus TaxID=2234133 RepID=UPI000DCF7E53|nr:FGGY family carbohydrate kinase [Algibacillus agarilyticus]